MENGLRTYNVDRANGGVDSLVNSADTASQGKRYDSTVPFQTYTTSGEAPTGQVVEALIERANRLREDMAKSSGKTLKNSAANQNNNNAEMLSKSVDLDNETMGDLLGLKSSHHLNDSNDSIVTDLDGLENEQSLLDDLLYGGRVELNPPTTKVPQPRRSSHGKPPTGRSPSPSLARVSSGAHRGRRSRSRSLAQSSDSDTASRVSFDLPSSDLDDSGNGNGPTNTSIRKIQNDPCFFFRKSRRGEFEQRTFTIAEFRSNGSSENRLFEIEFPFERT